MNKKKQFARRHVNRMIRYLDQYVHKQMKACIAMNVFGFVDGRQLLYRIIVKSTGVAHIENRFVM